MQRAVTLIFMLAAIAPGATTWSADAPPASQPAAIVLNAADAKLQGAVLRLTFEKQPEICYWTDPHATVRWAVALPAPGQYDVELTSACAPDHGGSFHVSLDGQKLLGKTHPTAGWHHYKTWTLGTISVTHAAGTLVIAPAALIRGSLMNLRAVRLVRR